MVFPIASTAASRTVVRYPSPVAVIMAVSVFATGTRWGRDERDGDVPDPLDANIVYGAGLGGRIIQVGTQQTAQVQNVSPWPVSSYAANPLEG